MKKETEDIKRWKYLPCSKVIYRAIPIKIPTQLFTDLERPILSFTWKKQKPKIAKQSWTLKELWKEITILELKLYYRAIAIKTAWYWYRNRHVDQWNPTEEPKINPHTYGHLIFDKEAKTIQCKDESIFNKWCWIN